jgi:hypothetical protein
MGTGYRFKHITLTIVSEADIAVMVKSIVRSFRRLRQRAYWKNAVKGGAFVIEITGRPGAWHAHIHAVIETRWMRWERLRNLWMDVSTGRGVYIQNIPAKECINYLTKYLTKSDMPDAVRRECGEALSSFRMYQPFGSWHGFMKTYIRERHACSGCGEASWYPTIMLSGDDEAYFIWLRAGGILRNVPVRASP